MPPDNLVSESLSPIKKTSVSWYKRHDIAPNQFYMQLSGLVCLRLSQPGIISGVYQYFKLLE